MIEHIVLFRWTPDASPQAVDNALEKLRGLPAKIPGLLKVISGVNITNRAKGHTHVLIMHFKDRPTLDAFGPNPDHQHVAQNFVAPIRAESLVFDHEV